MKTDLNILIDISGSMASIKADMEAALDKFIEEQQANTAECRVSLYRFDDKFETAFENIALANVQKMTITPRGGTDIYTGVGRAINAIQARVDKLDSDERPDVTLLVIITDGQHNHNGEYSNELTKKLVEEKTAAGWKLVYLGANQDAVLAAQNIGINMGSTMTYATSTAGLNATSSVLCNAVRSYRAAQDYTFSMEDRTAAAAGDSSVTSTFASLKTQKEQDLINSIWTKKDSTDDTV